MATKRRPVIGEEDVLDALLLKLKTLIGDVEERLRILRSGRVTALSRVPRLDGGNYDSIGKYARMQIAGLTLTISLLECGTEAIGDFVEVQGLHGGYSGLCHVLEDHLNNDWEFLSPDEVGGLTSAPILALGVERDEACKIVDAGTVFWFPDYAVLSELETLIEKGEVKFTLAPSTV